MRYNTLLVSQENGCYLVRINRPHIFNKLSIECMEELVDFFLETAEDHLHFSVILAGQDDFFCSGGELGDYRTKSILDIKAFGKAFIDLHLSMTRYPKPIIAAVEGDAFGGGCSLVEACDLAVAADGALLGIPEILDGLAPAMGLSGIFAAMPKKEVMALGMLGKKLTAGQALKAGLVNEVVPKGEVLQKAKEIAAFFSKANPTSIRLFKELYHDMGMRDYENRLRMGQSMMISLFRSADGMEVLTSKEEGRDPKWTGQ